MVADAGKRTLTSISPGRRDLDPELRRLLWALVFFLACAVIFVSLLAIGLYH